VIAIEGRGLHTGAPGRVRFLRGEGPTRIRRGPEVAALSDLSVVDARRSTTVARADGTLRVGTVEHLFAALAAAAARRGLVLELEGPEVPLADGCARAFSEAIAEMGLSPAPSRLHVARPGSFEIGGSRYVFEPSRETAVAVTIDFGDARLCPTASWNGEGRDFRERIAGARTFGFERELAELLALGLASHVEPESVVVVGEREILAAGPPFSPDEPARHKLLDLMGDLFAHGGPPVGSIRAFRPGHAATHEVVRRALGAGVLAAVR
jgi:UDP-3-O-[3-hydroxymyristoyl] N-acetylglucosamine deacetylase